MGSLRFRFCNYFCWNKFSGTRYLILNWHSVSAAAKRCHLDQGGDETEGCWQEVCEERGTPAEAGLDDDPLRPGHLPLARLLHGQQRGPAGHHGLGGGVRGGGGARLGAGAESLLGLCRVFGSLRKPASAMTSSFGRDQAPAQVTLKSDIPIINNVCFAFRREWFMCWM